MCSTTLAPSPPPPPPPPPPPAAAAKNLSLLHLCTRIHEAHQVHALFIKTSQSSDPYFAGRLAEFYALSDDPSLYHARKLLDALPQPPAFIYNTLMRAHLNANNPLVAIRLYHRMLSHSSAQPPDRFSFTFALKACTQFRAFSLGQQLHSQVFKRGLAGDPHIRNKLIHLYATSGELVDARKVFDGSEVGLDIVAWNSILEGYAMAQDGESLRSLFHSMPVRDVVSWNTVMGFYIEDGQLEEAIATFRAIQESGECVPNRVTMINALTAIAHSNALGQGKWVHAYMNKQGIEVDDKLGSALINMYSKCGCTEGAIYAFNKTKRKSVDTWNAMLSGFTSNGQSSTCLELFSEMENAPGVAPNAITFSCLLTACSHGGLVDEGVKLFEKMSDIYGIRPDITHYGCMVDLFSRAGLFEKAEEIMSQMPMEPDAVMWKAVVAACVVQGNIKLGAKAGYKLIELAPNDNAGYVLLSNVYAKASDYNGVHKARKMMMDRGVKKVPGCSSIELHGVVHEFIAGDASHPRKREIYAMLDEMTDRLNRVGYEPDTEQVLLDIEDEELKESSLSLHSEKLALAFALISTEAGTSIRIVKNLRMCGDCHSAIKLLSWIYGRSMIIRDSNRFHHFENGSCSCGGYW